MEGDAAARVFAIPELLEMILIAYARAERWEKMESRDLKFANRLSVYRRAEKWAEERSKPSSPGTPTADLEAWRQGFQSNELLLNFAEPPTSVLLLQRISPTFQYTINGSKTLRILFGHEDRPFVGSTKLERLTERFLWIAWLIRRVRGVLSDDLLDEITRHWPDSRPGPVTYSINAFCFVTSRSSVASGAARLAKSSGKNAAWHKIPIPDELDDFELEDFGVELLERDSFTYQNEQWGGCEWTFDAWPMAFNQGEGTLNDLFDHWVSVTTPVSTANLCPPLIAIISEEIPEEWQDDPDILALRSGTATADHLKSRLEAP